MNVIFLLLKIILAIIGILLGIIVIAALSLLFVPIRYYSKGAYKITSQAKGDVRISWLLGFITFNCSYDNNSPKWKLKIFLFTIKSNYNNKYKRKAKKHKKKTNEETILNNTEKSSDNTNITEVTIQNTTNAIKVQDIGENKKTSYNSDNRTNKKKTFKYKFNSIKSKFKDLFRKIKNVFMEVSELKNFLAKKEVKNELSVIKSQIIKLLMHIKPVKLTANINLGFGEPDKTGVFIGYLCVLYCFYGKNINIMADFNKKIFELDYKLKGRIRLFTVLIILIKIYMQKTIINYIKNYRNKNMEEES